jgi:hypothetical protein
MVKYGWPFVANRKRAYWWRGTLSTFPGIFPNGCVIRAAQTTQIDMRGIWVDVS